ncbi:Ig-like domain-containing protein [Pantoea ananatis]
MSVDLDGIRYPGTVDANGNWSVTIPPNALNTIGSGPHSVTVNVVDATGNPATAQFDFIADLTPPAPSVDPGCHATAMSTPLTSENGITLTGNTGETGAGQQVVVTIGTTDFTA